MNEVERIDWLGLEHVATSLHLERASLVLFIIIFLFNAGLSKLAVLVAECTLLWIPGFSNWVDTSRGHEPALVPEAMRQLILLWLVLVAVHLAQLCLRNSTSLQLQDLMWVPLPDFHVVLDTHSAMQVAIEVSVGHHEEFVTNEGHQCPHSFGSSEVLFVPDVEMLVAVVDPLNFTPLEALVFVLGLWWIESLPELDLPIVQEVLGAQRNDGHH